MDEALRKQRKRAPWPTAAVLRQVLEFLLCEHQAWTRGLITLKFEWLLWMVWLEWWDILVASLPGSELWSAHGSIQIRIPYLLTIQETIISNTIPYSKYYAKRLFKKLTTPVITTLTMNVCMPYIIESHFPICFSYHSFMHLFIQ